MNIKNAYSFLEMKISNFINFLKVQKVDFEKKNNYICFDAYLEEFNLNVKVLVYQYKGKIDRIEYSYKIEENIAIEEKERIVTKTVNKCNELYNCIRNQSGSYYKSINSIYEFENANIYFSAPTKLEDKLHCIKIVYFSKNVNYSQNNYVAISTISMIGGLIWGLLFYFVFGFESGHTFLLFNLSMVGGLVFGIIMSIVMIIAVKSPPRLKIPKRKMKLLSQKEENDNFALYGYSYIKHRQVLTKISIENKVFITKYHSRKNVDKITYQIDDINHYSWIGDYFILVGKENVLIGIEVVKCNKEKFTHFLQEKLGYYKEEFNILYQKVLKTFIQENPFNIEKGYEDLAFNLTTLIYRENKLTINELTSKMYYLDPDSFYDIDFRLFAEKLLDSLNSTNEKEVD